MTGFLFSLFDKLRVMEGCTEIHTLNRPAQQSDVRATQADEESHDLPWGVIFGPACAAQACK